MTVKSPARINTPKDSLHYPRSLFEHLPTENDDCHWHVLYTKSRQEKVVAERLLKRCISFYLPLFEKTTYYRRCKKTIRAPLFSGYLFLYGNEEDRLESLRTNQVCTTFHAPDVEVFVADLNRIHLMLRSGIPVIPEARAEKGRRVRIRSGPMAGLEGTIIKRKKRIRIVVRVDFLQQGASVEVEDFMLETID